MKYADLKIQTQRESPNNARTQGFAFLVRAGYLSREGEILPLGERAISRLRNLSSDPSFPFNLSLPVLHNDREIYLPFANGSNEIAHCSSCGYVEQIENAKFNKPGLPLEEESPLEKVSTPGCNTIETLANFLNLPKEKTAKALMFTRISDGKLIFAVIRGDMQLSEVKLKNLVGDVRQAASEEINKAGAVPGYASPIGLGQALILVDDLIPLSKNLAAGANDAGYHYKNANYERDYSAEIIADITQAQTGSPCLKCGNALIVSSANILATRREFDFRNTLLALAEANHDDKGLAFPKSAAPFDVYLMQIPGKQIDTYAKAQDLYSALQNEDITVLFDDRDERAGVKFNDADLIGCPIRVTVGERALQNNAVEVKYRKSGENEIIDLMGIPEKIKAFLIS